MKNFPHSKIDSNAIPFGYFITAMQWFEAASLQDKLGAIFVYLNNGDPINATMIGKLLKHVYRETKEVENLMKFEKNTPTLSHFFRRKSKHCRMNLCNN